MPKISEIINPSFRSGTGKNGKPYVLMQIRTDDNKEAQIFAPAVIGDEVTLTYSEQYKNWKAEKVTAQSRNNSEIMQKLDRILEILEQRGVQKASVSVSGLGEPARHMSRNVKPNEQQPAQDEPPLEERIPF